MTPIIEDSTAGGGAGEIVIGLNGSKDTYALKGEEYLETDAHAAEPTDGLLNAKIKISDKVDTSKPGTYKVSYRVSDSSGHTAKAVRTVHVVESMETMQGGAPILMYHYVYDPQTRRRPQRRLHRSPYIAFESHSFGMHKPGGNVGHGGIISAMSRADIAADLKHAQEIAGGTQPSLSLRRRHRRRRAAVRDAGILCAFTMQNSWAHVGDDITALPRVRISREYSLDSFIALANG